jgi:hypothetical protein
MDGAAGLEGLAVHEVPSAQSPAARGDSPRERVRRRPGAYRCPNRDADPLFRQAG